MSERPIIEFAPVVRPRKRVRPVIEFDSSEPEPEPEPEAGTRPVIALDTDPDTSDAARFARFADLRRGWEQITGE